MNATLFRRIRDTLARVSRGLWISLWLTQMSHGLGVCGSPRRAMNISVAHPGELQTFAVTSREVTANLVREGLWLISTNVCGSFWNVCGSFRPCLWLTQMSHQMPLNKYQSSNAMRRRGGRKYHPTQSRCPRVTYLDARVSATHPLGSRL